MPSSVATFLARARSREAIAVTVPNWLRCVAGMTLFAADLGRAQHAPTNFVHRHKCNAIVEWVAVSKVRSQFRETHQTSDCMVRSRADSTHTRTCMEHDLAAYNGSPRLGPRHRRGTSSWSKVQDGSTDDNPDLSIGDYLIRRLQDYGIGHVFGIPGDYILSFYTMLEQSPLGDGRLHARGLRRLRRRRLRPRARHGRGVRDLLRRRLERLQLDRRGVRREIAGGDDHRLARPARADPQSAACTTWSATFARSTTCSRSCAAPARS